VRGLLLAALCFLLVVYSASHFQTGAPWAQDVCDYAGVLCFYPKALLVSMAGVVLIYALVASAGS
jgi:hypothetical protein